MSPVDGAPPRVEEPGEGRAVRDGVREPTRVSRSRWLWEGALQRAHVIQLWAGCSRRVRVGAQRWERCCREVLFCVQRLP